MATHTQNPVASAERVACARCEKTFSGGQVVSSTPSFDEDQQCFVVSRTCYCDHCEHLFSWLESSNERGFPQAVKLSNQGFIKSATAIARWLKNNAHTIDQEQA